MMLFSIIAWILIGLATAAFAVVARSKRQALIANALVAQACAQLDGLLRQRGILSVSLAKQVEQSGLGTADMRAELESVSHALMHAESTAARLTRLSALETALAKLHAYAPTHAAADVETPLGTARSAVTALQQTLASNARTLAYILQTYAAAYEAYHHAYRQWPLRWCRHLFPPKPYPQG